MEFLEDNEIAQWAREHGISVESLRVEFPRFPSTHRGIYASGSRSGRELSATQDLVSRLGPWDECLVWIREWGVWPSGEDWPKFYAWRGGFGGRRSLDTTPGHRFGREERSLLVALLTLIMENAWDADILCTIRGRAATVRAHISHDEWFEILGAAGDPAG